MLNKLSKNYNKPVIVSTHPRTRKRLDELEHFSQKGDIRFMDPFGFLDYIYLQKHAICTISDSGTISEESAILSFPAVSFRESMERPEAQDAGTIILTGLESDIVMQAVELTIKEHKNLEYKKIASDYEITNTSWRVLKLILGNTGLSNKWHGIDRDE